ncbi:MAG: DUF3570 domain-containing protein [Burkholderiaceae bacterium]
MTQLSHTSTAAASSKRREQAGAIAAAALLLPGLAPKGALAQNTPPEQGVISAKYLYYKDKQPGLDRIEVKSPSVYALIPFAGEWSFEGSVVQDAVSGATPRFYSTIAGATKYDPATGQRGMKDERIAGDAKLTRYFGRATANIGVAYSTEDDYTGRTVSAGGSWSTPNNNTTFSAGLSASNDKMSSTADVNNFIDSDGKKTQSQSRKVNELLVGVTQVLSRRDIVQANLTVSRGKGYYTDPYKLADRRPDKRDATILLLRWNRHFDQLDGTLRTSLRFYDDSFGINSQTVGAEWVQPVAQGWTLTPGLRYYSQSAADFYQNPIFSGGLFVPPPTASTAEFFSADQRLAGFGAVTASLKVSKEIAKLWSVDGKAEFYRHKGDWRAFGKGSPGLDVFDATFLQVGVSKKF